MADQSNICYLLMERVLWSNCKGCLSLDCQRWDDTKLAQGNGQHPIWLDPLRC